MSFSTFNDSWKFWIWDNVRRGSPKRELANILLEKGFDKELIINEFSNPNIFSDEGEIAPQLCLSRMEEYGAVRLSEDLEIFQIKNFLSPNECEQMIKIVRENCHQSAVIDYSTGGDTISDFRTSSTANLYRKMGDIINYVEDLIIKYFNIPEKFTEQIQGQYYKVGQQFKPHHDTFFPTSDKMKEAIEKSGNRTWTAMIYLNDVEEGGETKFTKINYSSKPETGKLLFWRNTENGQNVENSMHWGMPVIKGEKFVLTKWFREKQYQF